MPSRIDDTHPLLRTGISASALKTCARCPARWAYHAIAGLPRDETEATRFGKVAHEMAEKWLEKGIAPDQTRKEARVFLKGIHLLPRPGTAFVEQPFSFVLDGVQFDGYIDFFLRYAPVCGDHKFITDTDRYAMNVTELLSDIQAMLYALAICIRYQSLCATLHWIYYPKNKGKAKDTCVYVTFDHARAEVIKMLPLAKCMVAIRKSFRDRMHLGPQYLLQSVQQSIPKNRLACFDYSRQCPFFALCNPQ